MFLVQLAGLALHHAGRCDIPEDERDWARHLRTLTAEFSEDEPWRLVVDDWSKPAFMQPPVPEGVRLENVIPSPDALDLLITSRNHDLKQAIASHGRPEDWVFALVSLQTGEGYGGSGNQGVARMNGGSSSRPMLTLAPLPGPAGTSITPRAGAWFRRDVRVLVETRDDILGDSAFDYPDTDGLGLIWLAPWPEEQQLQTRDLDILFIEVCRRVRLLTSDGRIAGRKGTSKATRINAKHLKGALGDPYAPVHKSENKSFTLSGGDFDYRTLTNLFLSGEWVRPLLANPASFEADGRTLALVASALARGNSKTEGFRSRTIPIGGKVLRALGPKREELHQLAEAQVTVIADFDKALGYALALAAAGGEREKMKKELYAFTHAARARLDRYADEIFFEHLWATFEAQEDRPDAVDATKTKLAEQLWCRTRAIFDQALPPCLVPGCSERAPRCGRAARSTAWSARRTLSFSP